MTIDINKARVQLDSDSIIDHIELHANLKPTLTTFPDRLEAAEGERDWRADRCEDAMSECASLRAKIEAMEKQEPVAWLHESRRDSDVVTSGGKAAVGSMAAYSIPLYLAPGAKGEEK